MPPLENPRWERFARALFEGGTADEAYVKAGYSENRGNASRLKANENILARLAELQAAAAKASEVTVESLLAELEDARARANSLDQLSSVVKAISEKAKISGLLVQRVEVGGAGDFDACDLTAAVVDEMLSYHVKPFRPLSEADRQGLIDLMDRHGDEVGEYLAAINARPVVGLPVVDNPAQRKWDEIKAKRLTAPRTNGNGQR